MSAFPVIGRIPARNIVIHAKDDHLHIRQATVDIVIVEREQIAPFIAALNQALDAIEQPPEGRK